MGYKFLQHITLLVGLLGLLQTVSYAQRTLVVSPQETPPKIDGRIEQSLTPIQTETGVRFQQFAPNPLKPASFKTEVFVSYDDEALYIVAKLYDSSPDSILMQLSERDRLRNTDWFGVMINPYQDGINSTNFVVTPANVQYDSKFGAETGEGSNQVMQSGDRSWDGVWSSAARLTTEGWEVELSIPYSALRFPDEPIQTWDINFARQIRRYREESFWNPVDPKGPAPTTQMGALVGIKNIKPPIRLQATPFVTAATTQYADKSSDLTSQWGSSFGGGLDLKYGISDAFTLDMTAIPDFSNARSDDQVLNLTANELFFDENRAFFTEGVELFNKGGFFYSRRIGGSPINRNNANASLQTNEIVEENPLKTNLLNATKVSGRLPNGLGIGVFNAIEGVTRATLLDTLSGLRRDVTTAPISNYSVVSLDQNLANNSFVTLINTTVLRSGSDYDANLTGAVFDLRNKENKWGFSGSAAVSQQYGLQQQDAEAGEPNTKTNQFGHTLNLKATRLTGRLRYEVGYVEESDTYNPNDLGFLFFNNERTGSFDAEYNWFEPFGAFNSAQISGGIGLSYLYRPSTYVSSYFQGRGRFTTRDFFTFGFFGFTELADFREFQDTRTPGRYYWIPQYGEFGFFISSDYRKRFALDVRPVFGRLHRDGRSNKLGIRVSPRIRVNDKLDFRISAQVQKNSRFLGYVGHSSSAISFLDLERYNTPYLQLDDDAVGIEDLGEEDILGSYRDVPSVELEGNLGYSFTANMNLSLRVRHYWSRVNHVEFWKIGLDGTPVSTSYTGKNDEGENLHDQNFNAFNIDLFYRWRFAPGSDLFLSYKTQSFFSGRADEGYFANLATLGNERIDNSLTLKLVYFLDAATL